MDFSDYERCRMDSSMFMLKVVSFDGLASLGLIARSIMCVAKTSSLVLFFVLCLGRVELSPLLDCG